MIADVHNWRDDWELRIGGDPWKNVVMLECDAAGGSASTPTNSGQIDLATINMAEINLDKTPFRYERIVRGSHPFSESYLVAQTGRWFLLGPTAAASKKMEADGFTPERLNIVLLNWHPDHVGGLNELLEKYSTANSKTATVWTSHWIWEEILRSKIVEGWDSKLLKRFDGPHDNYPEFAVGVDLQLSYSLSTLPFLRAKFRCNHQTITIDPASAYRGLTLDRYATGIGREYLTKATEFPQFRDEIVSRYAEVTDELRRFDPQLLRSNSHCAGDCPVDLWPYGQDFDDLRFSPKTLDTTLAGASKPSTKTIDIKQSDATVESELIPTGVAVLILCGGLMNRSERELIDPGYELDVLIENDETERMSILEWRLRQLDRHVPDEHRVPVLLLTTPDTEEIVEACCRRYQRTLKKTARKSHLQITRIAAQLIPEIKHNTDGRATWFTGADGGWKLRPRGHMDTLRVLAQEKEKKNGGLLAGSTSVVVFALNNLGNVVNKETWSNVRRLKNDGAHFGVEVFRYKQADGDADKRWEQLSYCQEPSRPLLYKSLYPVMPTPDGALYYSSLTWYVDLVQLPGVGVGGDSAESRVRLAGQGEWPNQAGPRYDHSLDRFQGLWNLAFIGRSR